MKKEKRGEKMARIAMAKMMKEKGLLGIQMIIEITGLTIEEIKRL